MIFQQCHAVLVISQGMNMGGNPFNAGSSVQGGEIVNIAPKFVLICLQMLALSNKMTGSAESLPASGVHKHFSK